QINQPAEKQARRGSKMPKKRSLVTLNDWFWAFSVNKASKILKKFYGCAVCRQAASHLGCFFVF
ncbi:MAG: hypothetical protein ACI4TI_02230, partial [Christensenellales bacterium]